MKRECIILYINISYIYILFLSSHLIFPIALSLFPFNLTSLLLLPSPLASLRVQFLALFSSVYILRISLTFFKLPCFLSLLRWRYSTLYLLLFFWFSFSSFHPFFYAWFCLWLIYFKSPLCQSLKNWISSYWHSSTAFQAHLIHSNLSRNSSFTCFILSQPWIHSWQ